MSWRKIPMKFPGVCIVCNEKIQVNEIGLWAKGIGVKHEKCAETDELKCIVCGKSAGCDYCEFRDNCDLANVSPFCICKNCSENKDTFNLYREATYKKFSILNS